MKRVSLPFLSLKNSLNMIKFSQNVKFLADPDRTLHIYKAPIQHKSVTLAHSCTHQHNMCPAHKNRESVNL